ncbi:MAG: bifunctional nuclease family protein [Muribaculaceae bacterium]|nr:bifunctional nuclease family protein [Muribaculaceae bacterium]
MERIRLELLGITYNQIESGVYAVILQQAGGTRRMPIVIGFPEAQSIECKLQEVVTPRPLSHDLMADILSVCGYSLREVDIYKMPNGVFAATLTLSDGTDSHQVDARSSDAIALAIRVGAPIYTSAELLDEAGFEPDEKRRSTHNIPKRSSDKSLAEKKTPLGTKSIEELKADMQAASENENYEEAAKIKAEIERRTKKS